MSDEKEYSRMYWIADLSKDNMLEALSHWHTFPQLKKKIEAMTTDAVDDLASKLSDQYYESHFVDDLLYQLEDKFNGVEE